MVGDLRAEGDGLERLVAELPATAWQTATPAPGWTVAHQIAHLAWTDMCALLAVRDENGFRREGEKALAAPGTFVDDGAAEGAALPPAELLERWRRGRSELARELDGLPKGRRVPWFGPPMSAPAMATARLMETWAHGEDVADALGVRREPTARLRHVAWIGVRTRDFAYAVRGLEPPAEPFRVELRPPDGTGAPDEVWAYGPEDAGQRVTGPAWDFCRLVTQRTHRDDTALTAEGADADRWLEIAQAFAGPPGPGRPAQRDADEGPHR
ncbi:TIGR03084 family protein [Streptomyces armeniacus]|uniref:TIGR03084 family protein n=1 Tax=Streptomyces armeniacus TaxID=83291 RepID=A0A345XKW2_9ACTN|nr:TIGR03084 family protein [Streptomyces armeniacus]